MLLGLRSVLVAASAAARPAPSSVVATTAVPRRSATTAALYTAVMTPQPVSRVALKKNKKRKGTRQRPEATPTPSRLTNQGRSAMANYFMQRGVLLREQYEALEPVRLPLKLPTPAALAAQQNAQLSAIVQAHAQNDTQALSAAYAAMTRPVLPPAKLETVTSTTPTLRRPKADAAAATSAAAKTGGAAKGKGKTQSAENAMKERTKRIHARAEASNKIAWEQANARAEAAIAGGQTGVQVQDFLPAHVRHGMRGRTVRKDRDLYHFFTMLDSAKFMAIYHWSAMDSQAWLNFRMKLKAAGLNVRLFNGSLIRRAVSRTDFRNMKLLFHGNTCVIYSYEKELGALPAVMAGDARFELLGVKVERALLSKEDVPSYLAMRPVRDYQAEIVGLMSSPAARVTSMIEQAPQLLVHVLNTHAKSADEPPADSAPKST
ncbi:hypothetical protein CAOG_04212 [Capsaspora owczarzaki ATCC 30864]|uniref:Ribosomal protein L10 n=1 Tax=Capsaspora owczarzaki (strain ATCC 30864) TaxID=595528 RepID=A0A0D2X2Z5_CAPO3|nr:hypothetical protein CAOG_04212 [Capsaspora owczarzaki ATCC 30864]KJE93419.1 hypothetical protein CAOG_004212 [Capsaspora owczarzaki ATCC 30864]|eukprot:XP_004348037.1 hypothetical protein CAOG_04212 [Capsaspora owczarzaki ATCC 30864]